MLANLGGTVKLNEHATYQVYVTTTLSHIKPLVNKYPFSFYLSNL